MKTVAPDIPNDAALKLCRTMMLIRRFEEKIVEVYGRQDMKTPVHLCIGQEAVAAGVCAHLRRDDYLFTTHRGHGHCLAKGMDPKALFAELYGRRDGCAHGKAGSMHPVDPDCGILGASAIVGGVLPLAVGAALAARMQGTDRLCAVFFGDGGADEGTFHESLNFASLKKLPVLFVCENNFYATNSPILARQPDDRIAPHAAPYGIPGVEVDGNDVAAVYRAAREAVERARRGDGPSLLECRTYRWKGHVGPTCDHERGCRPKAELDAWMERCPVESFNRLLVRRGVLSSEALTAMASEIDAQLEEAVQFGRQSPYPDPGEVASDVYFEGA